MERENYVPPYCNTGVQNTKLEGLRACVDWVQGTLKVVKPEIVIHHLLKLNIDDFMEEKNGQYGYKRGLRFGNIVVYYDGNPGMGVHFQMSGQGCREYEALGKRDWKELFSVILEEEGSLSRLDVAVDDFDGYFNIPSLVRKIKGGELISKFKTATRMEKIDIGTGLTKGTTIYYGSSSSDVQIRMYEKNYELEGKGIEVGSEITTWNRTEIQLRNERAVRVAEIISKEDGSEESVGNIVKGILSYYLRFTVKSKDLNKSRWKTAPFWDKFLDGVEKLRLAQIAPDRTVPRAMKWVNNQVSKSLAVIYEAYGEDMEIIKEFIDYGKERMGEKEEHMIKRFHSEYPDVADRADQMRKKSIKKARIDRAVEK